MTISEAIRRVDTMKPNSYSSEDKIAWLSKLDGAVKAEIIDTHEDGENIVFNGYDESTPKDTELLICAPYDDIYLHWLESRIDYYNGEYGRYNNTVTTYNSAYSAYERFYNRAHMPKGDKLKFF